MSKLIQLLLAAILAFCLPAAGAQAAGTLAPYFKASKPAFTTVDSNGDVYTFESGYVTKRSKNKSVLWKYQYTNSKDSFSAILVSKQGNVYVQSEAGNVTVLSTAGKKLWSFTMNSSYAYAYWPVLGSDGTMYILLKSKAGKDALYVISSTGAFKWKYEFDGEPDVPVVGSTGEVYVVSGIPSKVYEWAYEKTGIYYLLDKNGKLVKKWNGSFFATFSATDVVGTSNARTAASGDVYSIVTSGTTSYVYAYSKTGTLKWKQALSGKGASFWLLQSIGKDGQVVVEGYDKAFTVKARQVYTAKGALQFGMSNLAGTVSFHGSYLYVMANTKVDVYSLTGKLAASYTIPKETRPVAPEFFELSSDKYGRVYMKAGYDFFEDETLPYGSGPLYQLPKL